MSNDYCLGIIADLHVSHVYYNLHQLRVSISDILLVSGN
jgi:hypothetical protein